MTSRTKGVRKNKGTSLQANLEPKQIPGEGSQDANMQSTMASRIKGRRKATVNAFVQTQYIVNDSQINLEPIQIQSDANHPAEFSTTQDTGQSSASSCTNKKKARGESRNLKLLVDFPKGGVQVEFKNGKPVGDSAQYLITEMGVVLKNPYNAPLNVKCWDDIDDKKKDKIWMILKGKGLSNKDFFELTHRKKNGDWVDTSSRQIMENYEKKINDRQAEDASTDIDDNEIFTEIIGQKQRGHIRGKQ